METLLQDVRYATRAMLKSPGFTGVAILSLALGIGANAAIFSLVNTILFRPLPVFEPSRLVELTPTRQGSEFNNFSYPLYRDFRDRNEVFDSLAVYRFAPMSLSREGNNERIWGFIVSGNYFDMLGVKPAAGRFFAQEEDRVPGASPVAVVSYGCWQRRFGGDPGLVGKEITINGNRFDVVGIAPEGFAGTVIIFTPEIWVPTMMARQVEPGFNWLDSPTNGVLFALGRLKPGVSETQATQSLNSLMASLVSLYPHTEGLNLTLSPPGLVLPVLRNGTLAFSFVLMAAVGLVLLIACTNLANMLLARATRRRKEIAIRLSLGASRARLIRQLLTECVLLSSACAVLGILFAEWGNALLVRYLSTARNKVFLDLSLDWRILSFTATVAIFTGFLFGIVPAFRSTRVSLTSAMKGSQTAEGERRTKFRPGKWIVASQVALSLVLLVAAGLFLRSLVKLATLDIGFDRNNVLIVRADLNVAKVPEEQQPVMLEQLERQLQALPGVVSVGRSVLTPMGNFMWNNILQVDSPDAPTGENAIAFFNFISPGYFQTMRTPLLAGRNFNERDTKSSPHVAIVNETLARKFFPKVDAVGKYFRVEPEPGQSAPLIQIVGITKDAKYQSLREDTSATAFFPLTQITEHTDFNSIELRTATRPSVLVPAIQEAISGLNKDIPLEFHTLAEQVDDSLVQERLLATLSIFFGGLALLLAMIGLYGALSYLVTLRRAEFGIRLALGALPGSILSLVMRDVAVVVVGGLAGGALLSFLAVRLLQKLLFGLSPHDPLTIGTAIGLLAAVALLAGYLPARRAMRVDPMVALRYG